MPVARRHVVPPSTDTSTPPTTPSASVAVPETVTIVPAGMLAPDAGEMMVEDGAVVSVLALAGISALWIVAGCVPMSASRLTIA